MFYAYAADSHKRQDKTQGPRDVFAHNHTTQVRMHNAHNHTAVTLRNAKLGMLHS